MNVPSGGSGRQAARREMNETARTGWTVIVVDSEWLTELRHKEPLFDVHSPGCRHYRIETGDDVLDILTPQVPEIREVGRSVPTGKPPGKFRIKPEDRTEITEKVRRLAAVLEQHAESDAAAMVTGALDGRGDELDAFLVSNELWGGAGSIADQAGILDGSARRKIVFILSELGEEQIRLGVVNVRTAMWIQAFRERERKGI